MRWWVRRGGFGPHDDHHGGHHGPHGHGHKGHHGHHGHRGHGGCGGGGGHHGHHHGDHRVPFDPLFDERRGPHRGSHRWNPWGDGCGGGAEGLWGGGHWGSWRGRGGGLRGAWHRRALAMRAGWADGRNPGACCCENDSSDGEDQDCCQRGPCCAHSGQCPYVRPQRCPFEARQEPAPRRGSCPPDVPGERTA